MDLENTAPGPTLIAPGETGDLARRVRPYVTPWLLELPAIRAWAGDAVVHTTVEGAVLFADLSGFTAAAEELSADGLRGVEAVSRLVNLRFGPVVDVIEQNGGQVVRFPGDAVLAIWLGQSLRDAVAAAVRAGEALATQPSRDPETGLSLPLKVVAAAGTLTLGVVGGVLNRWEPLMTGPALDELWAVAGDAAPGVLLLSPGAREVHAGAPNPVDSGSTTASVNQHTPPKSAEPLSLEGLQAFVPRALIGRLVAADGAFVDELRIVTVVFIRMTGVRGDARAVMHGAHEALRAIQSSLYGLEGAVDKLNQDDKGLTVLAAFGLPPLTHEDDALRAVLAAEVIATRLAGLGLGCSIGIATGQAFCGGIGGDQRREYTLLGAVVNRAARLMMAMETGVRCDDETRQAARHPDAFEAQGALDLKGIVGPVEVFGPRPAQVRAGISRPVIRADSKAHSIGRDAECRELGKATSGLLTGTGFCAVISGQAGIGKTRLLADAVATTQSSGTLVLAGHAEAVFMHVPYHAFRRVMAQLLSLPSQAPEAAGPARLAALTRRPELLPLLAPLLESAPPDSSDTETLIGPARRDALHELLGEILSTLAASTAVLISLEDVHWMDAASWAMFSALRPFCDAARVGWLLTARPAPGVDFDPTGSLSSDATVARFPLGPLDRSGIEQLLVERLAVARVAGEVVDTLAALAQGNPLATEQLAAVLIERGDIAITAGVCRAVRPIAADGGFQTSLSSLATTRLDRLPIPHQIVLKTAAVLGHHFEPGTLGSVLNDIGGSESLADVLAALTRDGFLVPGEGPRGTLAFNHVTTRDAAYGLMLFAQRQHLHDRVATELEALPGSVPTAVLAHHWRCAGAHGPARIHADATASAALRTANYREAIFHLEYLLAEAPGTTRLDRARWHSQLGEAQVALGNHAIGRASLETSLELSGTPVARSLVAQVGRILVETVRQVVRRMRRGGTAAIRPDRALAAAAFEQLGYAYYAASETVLGIQAALRMLNLAEDAGPSPVLARAYAATALTASVLPWHRGAHRYQAMADALASRLGDPATTAYVAWIRATRAAGVGDWSTMEESAALAQSLAARASDYRLQASVLETVGLSAFFRGDIPRCEAAAREQFILARRHRNLMWEVWAVNGLAETAALRGDWESVLLEAEAALRLLAVETDRTEEIRGNGLRASAHLARGEFPEALAAARRVLALQRTTELTSFCMYSGYVGAAQVLADGRLATVTPRESRLARNALRRFAEVFPIARPQTLQLDAIRAANPRKAAHFQRLASASAHQLQVTEPLSGVGSSVPQTDIAGD